MLNKMDKYTGTKHIEAEPMSLGVFIETRRRNPYENSSERHPVDEPGYLVKYEDGYESWSPKEVFEKHYRKAETFLDRIMIEYTEVKGRLDKCKSFLDSPKFRETLPKAYSAFLLALQCDLMDSYCEILGKRIDDAMSEPPTPMEKMSFGIAIEALKFGLAIRRRGWNGKGLFVVKQVPAHISGDVIPKMQSLPDSAKTLIMEGRGYIDYTSQCLIYNQTTGRADSWVPSVSDIFAEDWEIV